MTRDDDDSWPERPYKGLQYYGLKDSRIFAARKRETHEFAHLVAANRNCVTILHGTSGSGKSSFLRAGVIPFLERESHAFEFPRLSPELFVRSTGAPLVSLAAAVYTVAVREVAIATPRGSRTLSLRSALLGHADLDAFVADVGRSPERMRDSLIRLAAGLPTTVVLVIDQAEEVLTLRSQSALESSTAFFELLARFTATICDLKIVISIRTEFFGRFWSELLHHGGDMHALSEYLLVELDNAGLVQAIKHPTGLGHYPFRYELGLPERIAADVLANAPAGGALPAMQIVCNALYERGKSREVVAADYLAISNISEQIGQHVDLALLDAVEPHSPWHIWLSEVFKWQRVLGEFVLVQAEESVTTKLLSLSEIRRRAQKHGCRGSVDCIVDFLAGDTQRILRRIDAPEADDARYSLGHDVLGRVLHERALRWASDLDESSARRRVRVPVIAVGIAVGLAGWAASSFVLEVVGLIVLSYGVLEWAAYGARELVQDALTRRFTPSEGLLRWNLRWLDRLGGTDELRSQPLTREWLRRDPQTRPLVDPPAEVGALLRSPAGKPGAGVRLSWDGRINMRMDWWAILGWLAVLSLIFSPGILAISNSEQCEGAWSCLRLWATCNGEWSCPGGWPCEGGGECR